MELALISTETAAPPSVPPRLRVATHPTKSRWAPHGRGRVDRFLEPPVHADAWRGEETADLVSGACGHRPYFVGRLGVVAIVAGVVAIPPSLGS